MKIREFRIEDYPIVRDLWQTAGLTLRPGDELEDVKLKLQRDPELFLVAEQNDEIVGSIIGGWGRKTGLDLSPGSKAAIPTEEDRSEPRSRSRKTPPGQGGEEGERSSLQVERAII